MKDTRLPVYLDQIIESTRLACSYVEGLSKEDFFADKRTQQAVILNLLVIGETAVKLSADHAEFLDLHSDIP